MQKAIINKKDIMETMEKYDIARMSYFSMVTIYRRRGGRRANSSSKSTPKSNPGRKSECLDHKRRGDE